MCRYKAITALSVWKGYDYVRFLVPVTGHPGPILGDEASDTQAQNNPEL